MKNIDTYYQRYQDRKASKRINCWVCLLLGIMLILVSLKSCINHHTPIPDCVKSHTSLSTREVKMAQYFYKHGSKVPEEMAIAVLKTKSPRILAKIAVTESNGNHNIRKYGYRKAHDGAFGVNRKDWGPVSVDPIKQALQAEDALDEFKRMAKGDLNKALNLYGGCTKNKYSKKILLAMKEVP